MPLLGLVMMVKNEAASIQAVLEAVLPHVGRATIFDTGSTDGTQDIVKATCDSFNTPLAFFEGNFIDYGTTRNEVLSLDRTSIARPKVGEAVGTARFQLMLSGDEYISDGEKITEELEKHLDDEIDLFVIKLVLEGKTMHPPRIFRSGSAWRYVKRVHEFPTNPNPDAKIGLIPGAAIEHVVSDSERRVKAIWEVHVPMLREDLEKNPEDTHALMFLAQSYEEVLVTPAFDEEERKHLAREAVALRATRMCLPGEPTEKHFCMMHLIDSARVTGDYSPEQLYELIEQHCETDPYRPDAALLRAQLAMTVKPMRVVYDLATHVLKVAETARSIVNTSTVDLNCVWQAHRIAAMCARQMAAAFPNERVDGKTMEERMQEHVQAGLDAGGPWIYFRAIITPREVTDNTPTDNNQPPEAA